MSSKYDQAYEELKREDFLIKIKNLIPFIVSIAVLVLLATGIYTWHDARYEKRLYKAEKEHDALCAEKKKPSHESLTNLLKSPGMEFVTYMTFRPTLLQNDNTFSPLTPNLSFSVQDFFKVNDSLFQLNGNNKIEPFNQRTSVWYPFAASYGAFSAVKKKDDDKKTLSAFSFVLKAGNIVKNGFLFSELASLCKIGLYSSIKFS